MNHWTLELPNGSQLTLWEHAIAYIQWRYDEPGAHQPDKCNVILKGTGQTIELWRDSARTLYQELVTQNALATSPDDPGYFIL